MSLRVSRPVGNRLLDELPAEDYGRLVDDLQPVTFSLGEVIYEPGAQMDHAGFPTTFHASLLCTTMNDATAEMGLAGNEGCSALPSSWAVMQHPIGRWFRGLVKP